MKLKKGIRRFLIIVLILLLVGIGIKIFLDHRPTEKPVKEVKVESQIEKYGYSLKENKPKQYKTYFKELEKILNEKEVNEEEYAKKLSEMFIYDFYSLNDKTAKTDIGGVEFVHKDILENFLQNAQNTYYKYVESNIYNNRKQSLPVATNINVESINKAPFAYGDKTDENAYSIAVTWSYTDDQFNSYQKNATLVWVHDDIKLCLVELQ